MARPRRSTGRRIIIKSVEKIVPPQKQKFKIEISSWPPPKICVTMSGSVTIKIPMKKMPVPMDEIITGRMMGEFQTIVKPARQLWSLT